MQCEAICLDTVEEGALLHHHFFERWEHIVVTFLHVLVLGLHRCLLHKLLHIGNLSSEVVGALLQAFLQQGIGLIVGRSDYDLTVLQLEALGYIHKLGLYSTRACLIFGNELREGTAEMTVEQVEHTVEDIHERTEVEQFAHHRQIVVALQLFYLSLARRVLNGVRGVFRLQPHHE